MTDNLTLLLGLVTQIVLLIAFWVRASDRAKDAGKKAEEATKQIAELIASLAEDRVRVTREFVSRDTLREAEERMVNAIDRLGDRLDRLVEGLIGAPRRKTTG